MAGRSDTGQQIRIHHRDTESQRSDSVVVCWDVVAGPILQQPSKGDLPIVNFNKFIN
jgi:hypothetical protein